MRDASLSLAALSRLGFNGHAPILISSFLSFVLCKGSLNELKAHGGSFGLIGVLGWYDCVSSFLTKFK